MYNTYSYNVMYACAVDFVFVMPLLVHHSYLNRLKLEIKCCKVFLIYGQSDGLVLCFI